MAGPVRLHNKTNKTNRSVSYDSPTNCRVKLDGAPFFEGLPGGDVALVIGNEARGVSEGVRALATHRLKLPMPGRAESLNAAVAAGIMIYACISGRR